MTPEQLPGTDSAISQASSCIPGSESELQMIEEGVQTLVRRPNSSPGTGGATSQTSSRNPGTEFELPPTGGIVRSRLTRITLLRPSLSVSASNNAP